MNNLAIFVRQKYKILGTVWKFVIGIFIDHF